AVYGISVAAPHLEATVQSKYRAHKQIQSGGRRKQQDEHIKLRTENGVALAGPKADRRRREELPHKPCNSYCHKAGTAQPERTRRILCLAGVLVVVKQEEHCKC